LRHIRREGAMGYALPPVNWLRAFEAAARHASFAAAAGELSLTSAAISHQVRSLEAFLGYPLFERLPRGLRLTDMGKAYLPPVRNAFDELSICTVGLFGSRGEATLNVRVPISFAVLWLGPRLDGFAKDHPEIRLRIVSAIWADALPTDKIDVDIRFGHGRWEGFDATLLSNDPSVLVTHPEKPVHDLANLTADQLIHIMGFEDDWLRLYRSRRLAMPGQGSRATADTSLVALEMAAAGMGFALVLRSFALPHAAQGRIRIVPGIELPQPQSHYLVSRDGDERPRPEALVFRDWILREMAAWTRQSHEAMPPASTAFGGSTTRLHR
jgi:LysR family glycine cleavage system transcriptional activator